MSYHEVWRKFEVAVGHPATVNTGTDVSSRAFEPPS